MRWVAASVGILGLAGVVPEDAEGKRQREAVEFTEQGVREPEEAEATLAAARFVLGPEEEAACVADLMDGHLGLGTLADAFLEGPAGVRVNLLSGNLVWRHTFLPHGMPRDDLSLSLTYNAQDDIDPHEPRANGVPARWRTRFQERLRPGPWGVMEIVEDDGFVHRFYVMREGQPVSRESLVDEIVLRRREGGVPSGESLPSGPRFRRRMEQDDAFLAAMRARFLGEGLGLAGRYVSEGRGHQLLEVDQDGSGTRRRADGRVDRFDTRGRLVARSILSGASILVERGRSGIDHVTLSRGPTLSFERDGAGRLEGVLGAEARRIRLAQESGQIVEISTAEGAWLLEYDPQTQLLVGIRGPRDWVRIQYDGPDRRVSALEGPGGQTRIVYSDAGMTLGATVSGPRGDADVSFDPQTLERTLTGPTGSSRVRFDGGGNRPLVVGDVTLTYDTAGRVIRVEGPGGALEVLTDEEDRPTAIRTTAGDDVELALTGTGLLESARDGSGATVRYLYDTSQRLEREEGARGTVGLERNAWGQVERVVFSGGDALRVDRDAAGRLERSTAPGGGELLLRWDDADRLVAARGPGDHDLDLDHGDDGSMRVTDADGGVLTFVMGGPDRLTSLERNTPPLRASIEGDVDGLIVGLSADHGLAFRARHEAGRLVGLSGGPTGDLALEYDGIGLATLADGASSWRVERDGESGRPVRVTGAGGLDLRLGYDAEGRVDSLARGPRPAFRVGFDGGGRPDRVDPAVGRTQAIRRDAEGRVVELVDGEDSLLRLRRAVDGRVTAAAAGTGEGWWLATTRGGWPHRLGAPDGRTWTLIGESAGRATAAEWPDGSNALFEWTAAGTLGSARWSGGAWYLLYGSDGRLARTEALLGGLVEYENVGRSLRVWRGGRLHRTLDLDPHGRFLRSVDGRTDEVVDRVSRDPSGALVGWRGPTGALELVNDAHRRPRELTDGSAEPVSLSLSWGMDGLVSGWEIGELGGSLDRSALGRVSGASYPVLPTSSPLSPLFRPASHAPPSGALAHALLHPYLAPPWARGGGVAAWGGGDSGVALAPPLPRWAIDRLWSDGDQGWAAALPEPPCAAVSVPDPRASERVTVPGALALLGFLPDDLSEHRVLASLPAPQVTVALPGGAELRALHRQLAGDGGGLVAVSVEPGGRGLVLHPDPPPVGHPTPWAAISDPLSLRHPASQVLGLATIAPAPGAADPRPRRFSDTDPLAERLRLALDAGRWWSPVGGTAADRVLLAPRSVAGALAPWTASRIQVVVDPRGRLRGLDLGASATDAWGRQVIEAFLGGALEGRAASDLSRFAPVWVPLPGAPPEVALGLVPGPGRLWPDRTGTARVAW